jgi:hypothetical protein
MQQTDEKPNVSLRRAEDLGSRHGIQNYRPLIPQMDSVGAYLAAAFVDSL